MPFIVAIHDVQEPDRFWQRAQEVLPRIPAEVTLHATYPQPGGSRAICLWQAPSVDALRELIDGATGEMSRNDYFEVDDRHPGALGLPVQAAAAG